MLFQKGVVRIKLDIYVFVIDIFYMDQNKTNVCEIIPVATEPTVLSENISTCIEFDNTYIHYNTPMCQTAML